MRGLSFCALLLAWAVPPRAAPAATPPGQPPPYAVDGLVTDDMEYEWIATRKIRLFARPGSGKGTATVLPGQVMKAEAMQLRGRPWEVRVLHDKDSLRAGMRLWILARDLDEGTYQLWFQGELRYDLEKMIDFNLVGKRCGRGSEDCWLWFAKVPPQEQWMRVRTAQGAVGWFLRNRYDDFRLGEKSP